MKTLTILGGPMGVGKTAVCRTALTCTAEAAARLKEEML